MDVEGAELEGLPVWLSSGSLANVQHIAIEIHLDSPNETQTRDFFRTFKDLHLTGNYRIFNWEANNCWKNIFAKNPPPFSKIRIGRQGGGVIVGVLGLARIDY